MEESTLRYGIVIPVYGDAPHLRHCLENFRGEKHPHKILAVLDGPNEKAEKILADYKEVEVIEIEHGGAPKARNAGAEHLGASADLLLFWDCDCFIEPGMLMAWAKALERNPDVDFVYSDYRFDVAEYGGIAGQLFDPWTLKCNNYISTMSPVRARVKPRFDENLESLQDWDLWLTLTKKGCKGLYVPGTGFLTAVPDENSISGKGCAPSEWLKRKNRIKDKHEIAHNPICIASLSSSERGVAVAKGLKNADFYPSPGFNKHDYRLVYLLGFYPIEARRHAEVFQNGPDGMKKVIHWMGDDVEMLYDSVSLRAAQELGRVLAGRYIHFCESMQAKTLLECIGINATLLKLPVEIEGLPNRFPQEFKILHDADAPYQTIMKYLIDALPDLSFTPFEGAQDMSQYALFIRLSGLHSLDEACKKYLLSGWPLISNVPEPHAGYVSDRQPIEGFAGEMTAKIREFQTSFEVNASSLLNVKAMVYYGQALSWSNFKETIDTVLEHGTEWKEKKEKYLCLK